MKNEFKAGDLVFELTENKGVLLSTICRVTSCEYFLKTDNATYYPQGINPQLPISRLFHATTENREALVTLYGEDAVPELPVRGSELTRKLLEKQKYVLCMVSHFSDDAARKYDELAVIDCVDDKEGWFVCTDGDGYNHAVPIDNNGNEITEIESC